MDSVSITSQSGLTGAATASTGAIAGGLKQTPKEAFLQLLVAQLEHQNPLEPVDNTEFTAQLAQFTSLEQLQTANTNLSALMAAQSLTNSLQASALIGKEVQAQANTTRITPDGTVTPFHYTLAAESARVQLTVVDTEGNAVRTVDAGNQKTGVQEVRWNGRNDQGTELPPGDYHYTVAAEDKAGRAVSVDVSLRGTVSGVTYVNQQPYVVVGGSQIELSDITNVNQSK